MAWRTTNPALNTKTFSRDTILIGADPMTVPGTVNKTGILLLCTLATAAWTWNQGGDMDTVGPMLLVGAFGGLIVAMLTIFKKTWAPLTAPLYALLEGLVIGGLSTMLEARFPGIAMQAAGLTFGTLFALLVAYSSGLIRVSDTFRRGVIAATGGIFVVYLVSMVLGFFGHTVPYIYESGPIGIAFSLVVVGVAAMNLVLDFDFIESAARQGAPKYMEWYAAFGLMVTLVWLYIEILNLLSKLRSRR